MFFWKRHKENLRALQEINNKRLAEMEKKLATFQTYFDILHTVVVDSQEKRLENVEKKIRDLTGKNVETPSAIPFEIKG